jgi:hypothetical protein
MKFRNLFIALFVAVTAISCKDEAKTQENGVQSEEAAVPTFKVQVKFVAKKNDDFCLLYTQDGTIDFKDGVWKEVKGLEGEQTIEFSLPKDIYPTQLRLDLGRNQDQEDIIIKSMKFEYNRNSREIKGFEMGVFFRADASKCTFDPMSGVVKALVKDGKREAPSLYPNETVLAAELPKLAK